MRKKEIEISGKRIFYYESRDHGNPVVLVHGMSSCSSIFVRQLIDSILSYQFHFIALDLLGHGNSEYSEKPETDYTIRGMSDFLVEFCDKMGIQDAVFAGHNIGANIILESLKKLKNPLGLVLLSSAPFANPHNSAVFQEIPEIKLFSKPGVDDSEVHQLASKLVEKGTKYPDFIPDMIRNTDPPTRKYFFESVEKGEFIDQISLVKNIKIPIAIYYGEQDQIVNFDYLNSIEIPNLWRNLIQIIPDSGHLFFYECPADFNISLEAFLNTVLK